MPHLPVILRGANYSNKVPLRGCLYVFIFPAFCTSCSWLQLPAQGWVPWGSRGDGFQQLWRVLLASIMHLTPALVFSLLICLCQEAGKRDSGPGPGSFSLQCFSRGTIKFLWFSLSGSLNICISFPLVETGGNTALWPVKLFHHTTQPCLFVFSYKAWHKGPDTLGPCKQSSSRMISKKTLHFCLMSSSYQRLETLHLSLHVWTSKNGKNTKSQSRNAEITTSGEFSHQFSLVQAGEGGSREIGAVFNSMKIWF